MSDHLAVCVDRLISPETLESGRASDVSGCSANSNGHAAESSCIVNLEDTAEDDLLGEEEPLIQPECRICQDEDSIKNLETPCSCNGSLKFAHRKCVQKWCNEKGDIICEICHQPYQPGYTAPPRPPADETSINISQWTVSGAPLDMNDPRILAMAAAERQLLLEGEYDEYADSNANGAAFCRSAALILMALLLLRHALYVTSPDEAEDDVSTFFSLFLLRAAGFLLPCYIMAWAISIMQRRRERQEAAALAASEVAYVIQAGQAREVHFTIAPTPAVALLPDQHQ